MKVTTALTTLVALGAGIALAAPASAATVIALSGDRDLVTVDSDAMVATGMLTVQGGSGRLLGIDVRPADGMLYGVFEDGTVATIDPSSGQATTVSTLETTLDSGVMATVDFNPAADRLRVMGNDGTSLRINVDTGEVTEDGSHAYADDDENASETPDVIAGAYTNSFDGTETTQLFNIDGTLGAVVLQDPPNDGILNTVGSLGIDVDHVGFDILSDGMGANDAWLMSGGVLYSVDLETGTATEVGPVEGAVDNVRDIAILPMM